MNESGVVTNTAPTKNVEDDMTETPKTPKEPDYSGTWIYKSKYDFVLVLKPTTKRGVPDFQGGYSHLVTERPIKVRFVNGTAVLNDNFARKVDKPLSYLVKLMEEQPGYDRDFVLVESPTFKGNERTKKIAAEAERAAKRRRTRVIHGARTTSSTS